jgi:hypothetical protein
MTSSTGRPRRSRGRGPARSNMPHILQHQSMDQLLATLTDAVAERLQLHQPSHPTTPVMHEPSDGVPRFISAPPPHGHSGREPMYGSPLPSPSSQPVYNRRQAQLAREWGQRRAHHARASQSQDHSECRAACAAAAPLPVAVTSWCPPSARRSAPIQPPPSPLSVSRRPPSPALGRRHRAAPLSLPA